LRGKHPTHCKVYELGNRGGDNRKKGPTARADVHVTLEELYLGTSRDMTIARNVYCPKCRGTGAKDGKVKQCPKCNGQG
jgi:DnaJ-class molecular chaperone